jgi:hypothetical protein
MSCGDNADRALLFSSIEHTFNPRIFFMQFIIHLGFPFTLFLSPNPAAQGFFALDRVSA